jgi:hypothetical protein
VSEGSVCCDTSDSTDIPVKHERNQKNISCFKKMSSIYASMLKRAQEIQRLDEEENSRNLLPVKTQAAVKEISVRDSKKSRDTLTEETAASHTLQSQHQKILDQEKLSRQVFKEEISFLHCSGTRDLNTK